MCPPDTLEMFCWYFMCRVTPQEWVITEIRTLLRWSQGGSYFSYAPAPWVLPNIKHIQNFKNRGDHFVK
jgi:hypothetical protein